MQLINTSGMALIGPGSEWFWTAFSGIVLGGTFLAIYRQLRLQRATNAVDQAAALAREWLSEPMSRNRLAILVALRDGVDPADVPPAASRYIGNFWERIGFLVRFGHMDARVIHETFIDVGTWWRWLQPVTMARRAALSDAEVGQHFEWLAAVMDRMASKRGVVPLAGATLTAYALRTIEENEEAIRTAEAVRAVPALRAPVQRPSRGRGR